MSMFKPTEKLCCFPLETGLKYWGWFSVVMCSLSAIASLVMLITYVPQAEDNGRPISLLELDIIYSVMIGVALLSIGTSYMIVMAVNQRKRSLLMPYLISSGLTIAFWVIVLMPLLFPVFIALSPMAVAIYIGYCVYSLYVRLRAEEENQQNQYNETSKVTSPQYAN